MPRNGSLILVRYATMIFLARNGFFPPGAKARRPAARNSFTRVHFMHSSFIILASFAPPDAPMRDAVLPYRISNAFVVQFQNTILPEAVHFWERALMVRETKSTIRLNR
jgi:hypothetical protein